MSKIYTPREAAQAVLAGTQKVLEQELARLQAAEAAGNAMRKTESQPGKSVYRMLVAMRKAETFIDLKHSAEPGSDGGAAGRKASGRYVEPGKPPNNLPGDKPEETVSAPGSGGEEKSKAKESKEATPSEANLGKAAPDAAKAPAVAKPQGVGQQTPAKAPAGIPGASTLKAPTVPAQPKAPGMRGATMKNEKGVLGLMKRGK